MEPVGTIYAPIHNMHNQLPNQLEPYLDERLSHLIFRRPSPDLPQKVRDYLAGQGNDPIKEKTVSGEDGESWLIFSLDLADTRTLVLEMVGQGFGEGVLAIDARLKRP